MIKKHCPKCGRYSYSSCEYRKWLCPVCGEDLTEKPVMSLDDRDREGPDLPRWGHLRLVKR